MMEKTIFYRCMFSKVKVRAIAQFMFLLFLITVEED